ncbi:copper resistance protein [Corynebacterium yudongzhengii]|uniref:Copper resistance protein n=1 Tax=Corynebacterium yudongzhengii TaxID=2080740 RepID=A0A2U1T8S1_9CORY|nr:cytochrome c oxidase assembly protein [Corynebacterium yudongzhengii]AWB82530.1 copper resistance protein [Corynebacterium yudongzhengii]PWC02414.1 copper resistance protein [Corynebacterium yudongzhengii]
MATAQSSQSSVDHQPTSAGSARKARPTWPLYLVAILVAALVGATISYSFVGDSLAALGIPDPGALTTYGLPFLRAAAWILAALSIGSFLFAAFFIDPRPLPDGGRSLAEARLSVDGHIAARTGALSALAFAVVAAVMIPMTLSDISGTPFFQSLDPGSWALAIEQVATSQVWLVCTVIGAVVGIAGLILRTWGLQPVLFVGSVVMIIPLGMEGHAASGGAHDYGTNAYLWHLVFMAIWIGGLMALIAHGRRLGPGLPKAVRRYSKVALFSIIAVAISGVISMLIRIQITDLLTTRYGLIIFAKILGTVILALIGFWHRQVTMPQLGKKNSAFVRLAVGEVVVMAAIAGIAVTMGRTPPPPLDPNLSPMEIQLGYELYEEPTLVNVFTMWRFEILYGTIALLLAGFYLAGVRVAKRRGQQWRTSWTIWWLVGCASLFITVSSGIGMYMPATYSMHMLAHMLLSMVVPLFLTMGAPLTLVMRVWDPGENGDFTPHDWAHALCHSRLVKVITTPWVNLLQFLVFFYVLYLYIPLYEVAISEHAGHVIMNGMFLVSGYFYFWELMGPDHIPDRRPAAIRLAWLVISMPVHLFLGVYLMMLTTVMGLEFYQSLELPWDPDLLQDQRVGGGIGWAFGSFPLTFVFLMLFFEWRREEKINERALDERLDAAERRHTEHDQPAEATAPRGEEPEHKAVAVDSSRTSSGILSLHGQRVDNAETSADDEEAEDDISEDLDAYNAVLRRYHEGGGSMQGDYYGREFRRSRKKR